MHRPAAPVQLKLPLQLPLEDTLDVFTAARIARVSTDTIRRWCEAGKFPAWRPGWKWRIERTPFYSWMESRRNIPLEKNSPQHPQHPQHL